MPAIDQMTPEEWAELMKEAEECGKGMDEANRIVTVGYMCLTEYWYELGYASDGCAIYPSIEELREYRSCVYTCGIVEVEVRLRRVVEETKKCS